MLVCKHQLLLNLNNILMYTVIWHSDLCTVTYTAGSHQLRFITVLNCNLRLQRETHCQIADSKLLHYCMDFMSGCNSSQYFHRSNKLFL
jgi:hypothetical protein